MGTRVIDSTPAAGDMDNDGYPEIFVTNHGPNVLYRNNGNGTFTDISQQSGIGQHAGTGMGIVCLDYDNDHDTDIAVLNDVRGNFLFENDGKGKFRDRGLLTGLAFGSIAPLQGLYAAELYGRRRIGTLMGMQQVIVGSAGALGPFVLGLTIDATGGYVTLPVLLAAARAAAGVVMPQILIFMRLPLRGCQPDRGVD